MVRSVPNYSDQEVSKRASGGGKDAGRKATADKLFAQATQPPHDDDMVALQQLKAFSGLGGPAPMEQTSGWATADARNYGKMLVGRADPSFKPQYDKANDGSFGLGDALGGLLRIGAPIAGMAIPGIGTLGAMALGGLGNSAGQLIGNGKINPLESLAAGAVPGVAKLAGGALGGGAAGGQLGPQGVMASGGGTIGSAAAGGAGGGIGGAVSGGIAKLGGLGNVAKIGLGAAKFMGDRAQRKNAEEFANAQLQLRQKQLGMAEEDYGQRAPLRNAAFARLGAMAQGPMGSSVYR